MNLKIAQTKPWSPFVFGYHLIVVFMHQCLFIPVAIVDSVWVVVFVYPPTQPCFSMYSLISGPFLVKTTNKGLTDTVSAWLCGDKCIERNSSINLFEMLREIMEDSGMGAAKTTESRILWFVNAFDYLFILACSFCFGWLVPGTQPFHIEILCTIMDWSERP